MLIFMAIFFMPIFMEAIFLAIAIFIIFAILEWRLSFRVLGNLVKVSMHSCAHDRMFSFTQLTRRSIGLPLGVENTYIRTKMIIFLIVGNHNQILVWTTPPPLYKGQM